MGKIEIEELQEWVEDASDLEAICDDLLTEYCQELEKEAGMTRPITDDDIVDDRDCVYIWTDAACPKIQDRIDWLYAICKKYFPGEDVEISSYMYREF